MGLKSSNVTTTISSAFAMQGITDRFDFSKAMLLTAGTTSGKSDKWFKWAGDATSSGITFDLYGSLKQQDQTNFDLSVITQLIIVKANDAATGTFTIGGDAADVPGLAATFDRMFILGNDAGLPVTPTTGDILKITSSEATLGMYLFIAGRS